VSVLRIASWDDLPRRTDAGAVLVELDGPALGDAVSGLRRLSALDVPVVASLAGSGDATLLAAALHASYAVAAPELRIECAPRDVLALGITWRLERMGARSLLFGPQPLDAARLERAGIVEVGGDAEAAAERLATDPATALLVRSLRAAARSSAAESRAFDDELREL
jgi:enoyl-CoA hydratase/carnithine racemase